jgi:uncharacterized protein (DUF3820 family)
MSTNKIPVLTFGKYKNTSLNDVPLTYIVWLAECKYNKDNASTYVRDKNPDVMNFANYCINNQNKVNIDYIFTFGKHKNISITDVPIDYLCWIISGNTEAQINVRKLHPEANDVSVNFLTAKIKTVMSNFKSSPPEYQTPIESFSDSTGLKIPTAPPEDKIPEYTGNQKSILNSVNLSYDILSLSKEELINKVLELEIKVLSKKPHDEPCNCLTSKMGFPHWKSRCMLNSFN